MPPARLIPLINKCVENSVLLWCCTVYTWRNTPEDLNRYDRCRNLRCRNMVELCSEQMTGAFSRRNCKLHANIKFHAFMASNTSIWILFRSYRKIVKSDMLLHVRLSVCWSTWNNSSPTGRIFVNFDSSVFFGNLSWNFSFHQNLTRKVGALRKGLCTFVITFRWVLVRLRNVSDKSCRENENTHFMFNNFNFFFWANHAFYEITWTNILEPEKQQMSIK